MDNYFTRYIGQRHVKIDNEMKETMDLAEGSQFYIEEDYNNNRLILKPITDEIAVVASEDMLLIPQDVVDRLTLTEDETLIVSYDDEKDNIIISILQSGENQ